MLARLRMVNWECHAGETVLDLEPKVYGIFATKDGDADASSWSGKSSLTRAVDYALTGRLSKPTAARPTKSGWITDGEDKGEVDLTISDGSRIVRSMSRKGSERLLYFPPNDPVNGATQDAAQAKIDALLGLSRDDAGTWCFRQGEMAAILKMDPGPRLDMFVGWFRLGKLEECQGLAAAARGAIAKQVEVLQTHASSARMAREHALANAGFKSLEDLVEAIELATERLALSQVEVKCVTDAAASGVERARLTEAAARYDQVLVDGKALAYQIAAMPAKDALEAERAKVAAEVESYASERAKAFEDARTVARVGAGDFDGRCPIAGEACPAGDFVVKATSLNRARLSEANATLDEWTGALAGARDRLGLVDSRIRDRARLEGRIEVLRTQARELRPAREKWASIPQGGQDARDVAVAEGKLAEVARFKSSLEAARESVEAAAKREAEAAAEIARLERVAETPAAAALVFERARRQIAEGVLAEIEGIANEVLEAVGADLSVAITWGRDGAGLADACGACGQAFPSSRKVKHCARCGAERGQKVSERLDIEPSRRSGAADDLGSIAVTLGASRWLREDRESQWATATIDEPTAQMDAALVRSFMPKLPQVLRLAGFEQCLLVSHHRGSLAGMPGRIEVTSKNGRAKARVVA